MQFLLSAIARRLKTLLLTEAALSLESELLARRAEIRSGGTLDVEADDLGFRSLTAELLDPQPTQPLTGPDDTDLNDAPTPAPKKKSPARKKARR